MQDVVAATVVAVVIKAVTQKHGAIKSSIRKLVMPLFHYEEGSICRRDSPLLARFLGDKTARPSVAHTFKISIYHRKSYVILSQSFFCLLETSWSAFVQAPALGPNELLLRDGGLF